MRCCTSSAHRQSCPLGRGGSFAAGTDPTNAASVFTAGIEFVGGVPQVTWSPNLNTNGIERSYTIWGKTNLTDGVDWECPTNAAHRFFKVTVGMP